MAKNLARFFCCKDCKMCFRYRHVLKRHYNSHSSLRNYKCNLCQNSYKYQHGVNRHMKKLHSGNYRKTVSLTRNEDDDIEIYLSLENKENIDPRYVQTSPFPIK